MSAQGLASAQAKMTAAGVTQEAIDVFSHYYRELEAGATGLIAEADIEPLPQPTRLADIEIGDADARAALDRTVILKLNGG
ncbi:MAG: UTP--glucose-1-phosphate uridylyltransferase, partial [Austwickia sp.]|nr:UTP--glucose-1-phosphate uridylyltransferase [Austwickia sp.]